MPPPGTVTKVAHQEFGVPYVVYGTVYRMRDRDASVMSERSAASVWFEVSVVKAPGAGRVWDASFNETQRPLNQNLFNAPRYPGGGTRWLSAEELARWGAQELAIDFPTGPPETRGRRR